MRWIDARADSFETGLHQAAFVGSCAMCGQVAKCRGEVKTAARWFRQSLAGSADTGSWAFTLLVDLPGVLGMAGDATSARQALIEMIPFAEHHGFVYLKPEILLARAWVVAAEGSTSKAVAQTHQAAEVAAAQGQPAVEVSALHTAVCFGDRTVTDRLAELATRVDGPRAPAAAAHAAALAADDGAALHSASVQLEEIGALLLAADAAAAHTRHNRRGSAQAASTRAHRLTQACEGAAPPLAAVAATSTAPAPNSRHRPH